MCVVRLCGDGKGEISLAENIVMLNRTNQNAKFCYEKAVTAAQQAASARTPTDRDFWLDRQEQWIHLAASYDYQERLAGFIQGLRTLPKRPICSVCHVPMRAK